MKGKFYEPRPSEIVSLEEIGPTSDDTSNGESPSVALVRAPANSPQERTRGKLTPEERKIQRLRKKTLDVVADAWDCLHAAIKNEEYRGKEVKQIQIMAAGPIVRTFSPPMETNKSGAVHLHLSVPRPKK